MGSNARTLNYYNHGTAAPTIRAMVEAENKRAQAAEARASEAGDRALQREKAEARSLAKAKAQTRHQTRANAATQAKTLPKVQTRAKATPAAEAKTAPGISIFAILGTIFVAVLMVFVVLAQINFNETASESVRLNVLINELSAKHRALELSFESAVDIKEVERFARDELGMSRPDAHQAIFINTAPRDTAMIMNSGEERGIQGFGNFLKSLTEYFRK